MLPRGYPRKQLLRRLEEAVTTEQPRRRRSLIFVVVVWSLFDVLFVVARFWSFVAFTTLSLVLVFALGRRFIARAAPEEMRAVLDAVRDAPERIVSVRCFLAGVAPTTRFLEIRTAAHCLTMVADDDLWIFHGLQRLCPSASFKDDLAPKGKLG